MDAVSRRHDWTLAEVEGLFAGANSVFFGEKLLTTPNAAAAEDRALLAKLGLRPAL